MMMGSFSLPASITIGFSGEPSPAAGLAARPPGLPGSWLITFPMAALTASGSVAAASVMGGAGFAGGAVASLGFLAKLTVLCFRPPSAGALRLTAAGPALGAAAFWTGAAACSEAFPFWFAAPFSLSEPGGRSLVSPSKKNSSPSAALGGQYRRVTDHTITS